MKYIIDESNMYQAILDFPKQIKYSLDNFKENYNTDKSLEDYKNINKILILGMGGSAISGLLIKEILDMESCTPTFVNQNYSIPKWVDKNTLVIASSYSGNTEETLTACKECINKNAEIIAVSTGGNLIELLDNKNYIKLPKDIQPRAALGYSFSAILLLLNNLKFIDRNINSELTESLPYLTKKTNIYSDKDNNNDAVLIASKINNKTPIIYAQQGVFNILAYRFKCQLAENSKILSFNNMIPEMNHNEIEAFYSNNSFDNYCLIWIEDNTYHKKNIERFKVTSEILKKYIKNQIFINLNEKNPNMLCTYLEYIILFDWISFYCAINNDVDPTIIPNINNLKSLL
ncbi:bifunctional phosphoglucose/phosphomannose isomerase [Candidatus Marinimicrobia bacterium]|nr:bifunctional phosphoglucose/phosphomannose isomerase [Candidatus Neomarinimicrobiota bacterium]